MKYFTNQPKLSQFLILIILFSLLCIFINPSDDNFLWRFPSLIAGLPHLINDSVNYLMYDFMPIEVYDPEIDEYEERPLIKEFTRTLSGIILFCIVFVREILIGGVKTIVFFTGWDFIREHKWLYWPALPWTVVAIGTVILGYSLRGKGLALLAGCATMYIAIFGQWEPAMETLSFVLIAAPVSFALGLFFVGKVFN